MHIPPPSTLPPPTKCRKQEGNSAGGGGAAATVAAPVTETVTEEATVVSTVVASAATAATADATETSPETGMEDDTEGLEGSADQAVSTGVEGEGESEVEMEVEVELTKADLLSKRILEEAEQASSRAARMANLSSELKRYVPIYERLCACRCSEFEECYDVMMIMTSCFFAILGVLDT